MPTTKPFTDPQKAEIFARDRATCSFSGANLWLLDAPLRIGWQSDWVDHKKPLSRGGLSKDVKNGACASHTFNMKKRNNSADTTYLFENGHPTPLNHMICGAPPQSTTERLQRLAKLDQRDWYFNRAICWILNALHFQWSEPEYERTDEYWFDAAFKKLILYRKLVRANPPFRSLEERGIISSPDEIQEVFLSLRECSCPAEMRDKANQLSPQYARNSEAWWSYFHPEDHVDLVEEYDTHRKKSYGAAQKNRRELCPETFSCIESDYRIRYIPA